MKLAASSYFRAIPFTNRLKYKASSAAFSGSGTCSRLISNCPPPFSLIAESTGTSCASQAA